MPKVLSLPQQIYEHVANQITFGKMQFGQKIDENSLADRLAASRTPIREALIQLAADGFLDNVPRKGFFVKNVTEESMRQANSIVACLDFFACKLAQPRLCEKDYASMKLAIADMDMAIKQVDYHAYCTRSNDFHRCYYDASGNPHLAQTIDYSRNQCLRATFFGEDQEELFKLLAIANIEHQKIIELLQGGLLDDLEPLLFYHWTKDAPGMW